MPVQLARQAHRHRSRPNCQEMQEQLQILRKDYHYLHVLPPALFDMRAAHHEKWCFMQHCSMRALKLQPVLATGLLSHQAAQTQLTSTAMDFFHIAVYQVA